MLRVMPNLYRHHRHRECNRTSGHISKKWTIDGGKNVSTPSSRGVCNSLR